MDRLFSPSKKNQPAHSRRDSGQFYFVPREPGVTSEVRDEGAVVEVHTDHAHDETYEPKPVNRSLSLMSQKEPQHRSSRSLRTDSIHSSGRPPAPADGKPNPLSRTLFAIFGGYKPVPKKTFDEEGAKKVDPKIYFSLERTFLAWMKASVWIAGISIAIGSRSASTDAQALYGLFFLGVAIAFIIYALVQFAKRSLMVVRRSPGPYEDRRGPMILGTIFALSLTTQFFVFIGYYFFK